MGKGLSGELSYMQTGPFPLKNGTKYLIKSYDIRFFKNSPKNLDPSYKMDLDFGI